ncbi:MAG: hypothetical protein ACJAUZ_001337, partial [Flavobacteriaceae bacterium]
SEISDISKFFIDLEFKSSRSGRSHNRVHLGEQRRSMMLPTELKVDRWQHSLIKTQELSMAALTVSYSAGAYV